MKLSEILDDTAFRSYLDWNYPNLPYKIQLERHRKDSMIFLLKSEQD